MAVFLRKLLRIGGLPDELRAQVEAEGVIHLAEYLPVTRRFSGSVPGKRAYGNISSYVGSLVFTPQRVLGTLSSVPKLAGRTIDQPWDAPQSGAVKARHLRTACACPADRWRSMCHPSTYFARWACPREDDSQG